MLQYDEIWYPWMGREGDPKYNGPEAEVQEHLLRNQLIGDFLEGKTGFDVVLDCLNDQGIDPDLYLDSMRWNINAVMEANYIPPDFELWVSQSSA